MYQTYNWKGLDQAWNYIFERARCLFIFAKGVLMENRKVFGKPLKGNQGQDKGQQAMAFVAFM